MAESRGWIVTDAKAIKDPRCALVILDAGPVNSLWVADRLDLILSVQLPVILVDAIYDELTSNLAFQKDREVKAFLDKHPETFSIKKTDFWQDQLKLRSLGEAIKKKNAGEIAISDFLTSENGLDAIVEQNDVVLVLGEDMKAMRRLFQPEPRVHSLGTIGFLLGLERSGIIPSAQQVIAEMEDPHAPGRTLAMARKFSEPKTGLDDPADGGSSWLPASQEI